MAHVSALTYREEQDLDHDDVATARTSSTLSHCKGTCQAGICTTTPLDAYCCFSDLYEPEKVYKSYTVSNRSQRNHNKHKDKYMDRHHLDRQYEDRYNRESPHKDRSYHCWGRNMS